MRVAYEMQAELKQMGVNNVGIHTLSPGMVTTDLLMAGADNKQSKWFINCLAETPDTVAEFLVPRIRGVPRKRTLPGQGPVTGQNIIYLTPVKAYSTILARLILRKNKDRYVIEDS
jgi:chlorophyll(ide) b reductase